MIEANRRVFVLVGAFVLVVGATLAGILIFLGSATRVFSSKLRVKVCFSDVTGLRTGASVLLSGVSVGAVAKIGLGGSCGDGAQVDLALDSGPVSRLSADSTARLATMGLLGDRLVALVPGHASARLHAGAVLRGHVPPDATAVIAEAGETFDVLLHIARRFDETLASTDLKQLLLHVAAVAESLQRQAERAERGPGLLHLLIYDRTLERQFRQLGPAVEHVADASRDADKLMVQLDKAANDLSQVVAYVKSGQGTLGGVIYDPAIYEDLRTIVGRVRRSIILRALARFIIRHR
ncbi:MAG TPA: MlaD family protein [Polyangia bacterium]|nr:MlaD family protein [Polyangia bacterium]